MKSGFWLEQIPLWGIFLLNVALILFSIWAGTLLGSRRRRNPDFESEASAGLIITSMLGLLGFMLVFTFGVTAQTFQTRRQLFLDELNAIGTVYLRTAFVVEPQRGNIRKLLRDYVDIRADIAQSVIQKRKINFEQVVSHSESLHDQIWAQVETLSDVRDTPLAALFISSLNEMIDLHTSRVTIFYYRIPPPVWYVLLFITILTMSLVGYQAGLSNKKILRVGIFLALAFSAVIFLVSDLDRAAEGRFRVNQRPIFELQKKMQVSGQTSNQIQKSDEKTMDK